MKVGVASDGNEEFLCAIEGNEVVNLSASDSISGGSDSLSSLLRGRANPLQAIVEAAAISTVRFPLTEIRFLPPLRSPSKIICAGLNYMDHCLEAGLPVPSSPVVFSKFPSSITGPGDDVVLHPGASGAVDWEVELAVIIGATTGPSAPPSAQTIFGYTVANDISARDVQHADGQWDRGKSLDSFCPLGPFIVTPDELGDPQRLPISLRLNGEIQQESTTAQMIFPVDYLIGWLSASITLNPGDILLTGTPPGTGGFQTPPRYLTDGDEMAATVDGIGTLFNPVRLATGSIAHSAVEEAKAPVPADPTGASST